MSRQITLADTRFEKIEITKHYPDGGTPYIQVQLHYSLLDDAGDVVFPYKQIDRFSSEAGLPAGQTLPAAWETTFETLISDLETKADDIEQLTQA